MPKFNVPGLDVNAVGGAFSGPVVISGPAVPVSLVAAANGTFGATVTQRWFRADGTTLRAFVGFNTNNDQHFDVGTAESGGITRIVSGGNVAALTLGSAQDATFASTVGATGYTVGAVTALAGWYVAANTKGLLVANSGGSNKTAVAIDANNVVQVGDTGLLVAHPVNTGVAASANNKGGHYADSAVAGQFVFFDGVTGARYKLTGTAF